MDTSISKVNSPEEDELKSKHDEFQKLSEEIAERELELANLRNSISHFESRYFRDVGIKYLELDKINAEIAEKIAKQNPQNSTFQKEAETARESAKRTAEEYSSRETSEEAAKEFKPSEEIKKLYRRLALKIHPDKTSDDKAREFRTKLMAKINAVYSDGNIDLLRQILQEWESSPESVIGDDIGADLIRIIRSVSQFKGRLKIIEKEIEELKETEMYQMMMQVQEAEKNGKDLLIELADKIESDIELAKERFESLA